MLLDLAPPRAGWSAGVVPLPRPFDLHHGGSLDGARMAYEVMGRPDAPLVVVLGGISAGRHVASCEEAASEWARGPGWWEPFVGSGRAVDPGRHRVLGLDFLGGVGASTGPSPDAELGSFPAVSTFDQARALAAVLDHLGAERVFGFVGSSYGGMVGLAFGSLFPDRLDRLVAISATHETHPMATALRSAQRRAVALAVRAGVPSEGLAIARSIAMTTYRTAAEFARRFEVEPETAGGSLRFPVEDYLDNRGGRFAEAFTPEAFVRLSESIDLHRVDPATVTVPTTLLSVTSDTLVPAWQARELADALAGPCSLVELDSEYGHDAFLKETAAVTLAVAGALAEARGGGR